MHHFHLLATNCLLFLEIQWAYEPNTSQHSPLVELPMTLLSTSLQILHDFLSVEAERKCYHLQNICHNIKNLEGMGR